jgi:hypothetical protein
MSITLDNVEDNLSVLQETYSHDIDYYRTAFQNLDQGDDRELKEFLEPQFRLNIRETIANKDFEDLEGIFSDPRTISYLIDMSGKDQVDLVRLARQTHKNEVNKYDMAPDVKNMGVPEGIVDSVKNY